MAGIEHHLGSRDFPPGQAVVQHDALVRTVEQQVVPRLVLAQRAARRSGPGGAGGLGAGGIAEFAALVLRHDVAAALSYVASLRARGLGAETLYLDLLAPTARRLGDLWVEDTCSFAEVTVGVLRLQQVLHGLSPAFQAETERRTAHAPCALLVPVIGCQHTFGIAMVADFFRRAGWKVWTGAIASRNDLAAMVRARAFDVVGFSASCERHLDGLASCIRAVRRASCNRAVGVMVGGPVFIEHPQAAVLVGADATAADGRQAPVQAQALLDALGGCSHLDYDGIRAGGVGEAPAAEDLVSRERGSTQGLQGAEGMAGRPGRGDRRGGDRGGG